VDVGRKGNTTAQLIEHAKIGIEKRSSTRHLNSLK
jgi:hypothetical protein